jgi:hypothetical protein
VRRIWFALMGCWLTYGVMTLWIPALGPRDFWTSCWESYVLRLIWSPLLLLLAVGAFTAASSKEK